MAATPGARVAVLRFDQAQPNQSPVLVHPLDRVAVQLQLADHGRWGVKPSRAQRGKRHRPLTSTTQLLKGQTMLSLNEHHRTELSTLRATPIQAPQAARRRTRERIRQIENQSLKSFSRSRRRRSCATLQTASRAALRKSLESRLEARRGDPEGLPVRADEGDV